MRTFFLTQVKNLAMCRKYLPKQVHVKCLENDLQSTMMILLPLISAFIARPPTLQDFSCSKPFLFGIFKIISQTPSADSLSCPSQSVAGINMKETVSNAGFLKERVEVPFLPRLYKYGVF